MTQDQVNKIMTAIDAAEIKDYIFINDIPTLFYNNDNAIIKVVEDLMINIRHPIESQNKYNDNGVDILATDIVDVHELRITTTAEKLKAFMDSVGGTLTEAEVKLVAQIDKSGVDLEPVTGSYITFRFMTAEEYNKADQKKKDAYDEAKKFEMKPLINFYYLSKKEYDELDDNDKASYDELKELYDKKKETYLAPNQAAQISY